MVEIIQSVGDAVQGGRALGPTVPPNLSNYELCESKPPRQVRRGGLCIRGLDAMFPFGAFTPWGALRADGSS
jgi:hypothetical protein